MVMSAIDLVKQHNYNVTEEIVRHGLEATSAAAFYNIVKAIGRRVGDEGSGRVISVRARTTTNTRTAPRGREL